MAIYLIASNIVNNKISSRQKIIDSVSGTIPNITDMKTFVTTMLLTLVAALSGLSLKEAFDSAESGWDQDRYYDRLVELETGVTYTGGLLIGKMLDHEAYILYGDDGLDTRIIGNGAILDLRGEQLCISFCDNRLDISDCVVVNGNIRFRGINSELVALPEGSVRHVTFYKPHEYGVRLQGCGEGILIERNLCVDVIDTGYDYIYHTGIASEWLPTGTSYSYSVQYGFFGIPDVVENWSWHSDEELNQSLLTHFSLLCDWG